MFVTQPNTQIPDTILQEFLSKNFDGEIHEI